MLSGMDKRLDNECQETKCIVPLQILDLPQPPLPQSCRSTHMSFILPGARFRCPRLGVLSFAAKHAHNRARNMIIWFSIALAILCLFWFCYSVGLIIVYFIRIENLWDCRCSFNGIGKLAFCLLNGINTNSKYVKWTRSGGNTEKVEQSTRLIS